ncbi:MAG: SLBB domain-containing protein [Candidatus Latescibacterota bacterium]
MPKISKGMLGVLLGVVILMVICGSAFPQTLEELLRENQYRQSEQESQRPDVSAMELKDVTEKPAEMPIIAAPDERTALDRRIDPEKYIVGPGDEFMLYLWGQLDQGQLLRVNPEGKLLVPYVGPIEVAEKTLAKAKEEIIRRVKTRYDKIEVSVELSNVRRFRVFVTGSVRNPGTYQAWAVDRVSDMIKKAGGIGTLRKIQVSRQDGQRIVVDLDRFLRIGDLEANPYLKTGDMIYVPAKGGMVSLLGAVKSEGIYEFKEGESLKDLIELAGGLMENAQWSGVEVVRFKEDGIAKERLWLDLTEVLQGDPGNPDGQFPLKSDDQIFIRYIPDWHRKAVVWIYGEVKYHGPYPIVEGETTLTEVIEKAGGFTKDAFLTKSEISRWESRRTIDPEFARLQAMASVQGGIEGMQGLEYSYFKTKSREKRGMMAVDFERLFAEGDLTQDVLLRHGDSIVIPRKSEMVNITGEVRYPGLIPFERGQGTRFYIDRTGGFSWNADQKQGRVIKGKTGMWMRLDKVEQVEAGDTIFVPERRREIGGNCSGILLPFLGSWQRSLSLLRVLPDCNLRDREAGLLRANCWSRFLRLYGG